MKGTIRYLFWHGVPWKNYWQPWGTMTLEKVWAFWANFMAAPSSSRSGWHAPISKPLHSLVSPCGMCFPQTPDWLNPSLAGSLLRFTWFTGPLHSSCSPLQLSPTPSYSIFPPWISLFKALNYLVVFYVYYCLLSLSCVMGKVLYLLTCKLKKKMFGRVPEHRVLVNIYWTSENCWWYLKPGKAIFPICFYTKV